MKQMARMDTKASWNLQVSVALLFNFSTPYKPSKMDGPFVWKEETEEEKKLELPARQQTTMTI